MVGCSPGTSEVSSTRAARVSAPRVGSEPLDHLATTRSFAGRVRTDATPLTWKGQSFQPSLDRTAPLASSDLIVDLPLYGDDPVSLTTRGKPSVSARIRPLGTSHVSGEPASNAMVYRDVRAGEDLVHVADRGFVEEIRLVREPGTKVKAQYRLDWGSGIDHARIR